MLTAEQRRSLRQGRMSTLDQKQSGCFASMLCVRLPKVGKRSQHAAKRPLSGEQTLRWVTVESQGSKSSSSKSRPRLRVGEYHLGAAVLRHSFLSISVSS